MLVHQLTRQECTAILERTHLGRLACAHHSQPYIVPISFYFDPDDDCIYSFSMVGQKIHWMRDNPRVCVEIDDISDRFHWTTVVVNGAYEELHDINHTTAVRARALKLFEGSSEWWLPGAAKLATGDQHDATVVYRIRVVTISGRRAERPSKHPG